MIKVVKLNDGTIGKVFTRDNVEIFVPANERSYSESQIEELQKLTYTEGTEQDYISYIEQDFHFGKVIKTHTIGEYQIIEYINDDGEVRFTAYINYKEMCKAFPSLDETLTDVICYKYDGANSQANDYLWKMIK